MIFSKSFGYALSGILYIATQKGERINIDEIADSLSVPRPFLAKVMHRIAGRGIVKSMKGPNGGFSVTDLTLDTSLFDLVEVVDGLQQFESCSLRLKKCNPSNPCPLHYTMEVHKQELLKTLKETKI